MKYTLEFNLMENQALDKLIVSNPPDPNVLFSYGFTAGSDGQRPATIGVMGGGDFGTLDTPLADGYTPNGVTSFDVYLGNDGTSGGSIFIEIYCPTDMPTSWQGKTYQIVRDDDNTTIVIGSINGTYGSCDVSTNSTGLDITPPDAIVPMTLPGHYTFKVLNQVM